MNTLDQRLLAREFPGLVHVDVDSGPALPPDLAELEFPCCMGSAEYGLGGCTCWEPIYDVDQSDALRLDVKPSSCEACCHDCAYRNGSPERAADLGDELVDIAGTPGSVFACHQGMRRVVGWKHPLLGDRVFEAGAGDYRPPIVDGVAYRADGDPADLCAGWAAHRRYLLGAATEGAKPA